MPNHVSNQIEFNIYAEKAELIISEITQDGCVDFNSLIPQPLSIYQGNLNRSDDEDFNANQWHQWHRDNWGTKWNAYDGNTKYSDGLVVIYFETAWSIPYPFIIAFANKYKLKFTHKYFDEGHNFWGVDEWDNGVRIKRMRDIEDMRKALHIELRGFDYTSDADE